MCALITEIKNVANDGALTNRIQSLLIYKWHLDLMTSCKFPIHVLDTYEWNQLS
jgi:hypothetical protein